jgi:hypothetical protein
MGLLHSALPTSTSFSRLVLKGVWSIAIIRWTGGAGGGPDIAKEEMPPDLSGGTSACVRDIGRPKKAFVNTAPPSYHSIFPPSPTTTPSSSPAQSIDFVSLPLSATTDSVIQFPHPPNSPPLTPQTSSDSLASGVQEFVPELAKRIFPTIPTELTVSPVCVNGPDAPSVWGDWDGFVVDNVEENTRTLYAKGKTYEDLNLRENVLSLLELADECLECDGVVIVLDKSNPDLAELLHSLLYVGGQVVPPTGANGLAHDAAYVLIGLDL